MSEKSKTQVSVSDALAMLAECFNLPVEDMHADLQRDAIDDWDSMGALMLMAELDERFGIELTAELLVLGQAGGGRHGAPDIRRFHSAPRAP